MVSPKSSSSIKSLASLSKDDLGDSNGETYMTSLGRSRWGRGSTTEFLAQVIGVENVSFPSFMSNVPNSGSSMKSLSKGCPIMMSKSWILKTWKSRGNSASPIWINVSWRIPSPFRLVLGLILRDLIVGAWVFSLK